LIVHSNGTRFESQRFRIDFTAAKNTPAAPPIFFASPQAGGCCEAGNANQSRVSASRGRRGINSIGPVSRLWVPCWVWTPGAIRRRLIQIAAALVRNRGRVTNLFHRLWHQGTQERVLLWLVKRGGVESENSAPMGSELET